MDKPKYRRSMNKLDWFTSEKAELDLDMGGNGELPSNCPRCNGLLDFGRATQDKAGIAIIATVLICRDCRNVVELD